MTRTYLSALVLVLAFVALGCRGDRRQETQTSSQSKVPGRSRSSADDVKETYAVYDALLGNPDDAMRRESARHSHYVLMADRTSAEKLCFDPATQFDPRLRAAAQDFVKQNSESRPILANELNIGSKVDLISSRELDNFFSAGILVGWEEFRKSYPIGGYTVLSAVGFNADKSFAVVYSAVHCGPRCGTGGFVTLSKKNGAWRKNPGDRLCSWIS